MEFESARPSIVKSIKQRDLLNTWLRLYAPAQRLPRIEEFQPTRIEDELPDLVFLTVEKTKPAYRLDDSGLFGAIATQKIAPGPGPKLTTESAQSYLGASDVR